MREMTGSGFWVPGSETREVEAATVVHRTVGFGTEWEFVAETTTATRDGFVTVREFGHTAAGAMARAAAAARARMTARKRATGFTADGFREKTTPAAFAVGFA